MQNLVLRTQSAPPDTPPEGRWLCFSLLPRLIYGGFHTQNLMNYTFFSPSNPPFFSYLFISMSVLFMRRNHIISKDRVIAVFT